MKSNRLKTIASLIDQNSSVIDIGTDHGYLPIFLVKEGITTKVMATDVSRNALNAAKQNIIHAGLEDVIMTQVADGFQGIDTVYDVGVLAGMGTETMKQILQAENLPKTLILQSNNDLEVLRLFMNQFGWKIAKEVAVLDNGKYYVVIKYIEGKEILSEEQVL
ncbi:MAG: class I SAM-dependent methyltransferase, partial [Bacilli bacterium]|nr:class I SAM-dependent methyltransferase [Bacilli bacterium]